VSNLGMFGVSSFAAIVNPPQAAILACAGAHTKVVIGSDGAPREASTMTVTLSCDHRVIDGAVAASWLQAFKGFIENPLTLTL
jgi:pyruvate dehydrogenase E2 component (dihydrolipoamide acetyltransferase)